MVKYIHTPPDLYNALKQEGYILPDECSTVRLIMSPDSAYILQMDVFVRPEDLATLARAFQRLANSQKELRDHYPQCNCLDCMRKRFDLPPLDPEEGQRG